MLDSVSARGHVEMEDGMREVVAIRDEESGDTVTRIEDNTRGAACRI